MLAEKHRRPGGPARGQWATAVEQVRAEPVDPFAEARCREGSASMVALFFSEQLDDIARAKAICAECPLAAPCLEGALERREPWGVWGGRLFANGRVLAFKRKRGRPPKSERTQLTA